MAITRELVESVRRRVAENPEVPTFLLADELQASESEVITALPLNMRMKAKVESLAELWSAMRQWRNVMLALPDAGGPEGRTRLLPCAALPALLLCDGAYHFALEEAWSEPRPDHPGQLARLDPEQLGYIWFVSKPRQGEESRSVQLYDKEGRHLLSVYPGRDDYGQAGQQHGGHTHDEHGHGNHAHAGHAHNEHDHGGTDFESLRRRFGVVPVPRRCRGCGKCTCGAKKQLH